MQQFPLIIDQTRLPTMQVSISFGSKPNNANEHRFPARQKHHQTMSEGLGQHTLWELAAPLPPAQLQPQLRRADLQPRSQHREFAWPRASRKLCLPSGDQEPNWTLTKKQFKAEPPVRQDRHLGTDLQGSLLPGLFG